MALRRPHRKSRHGCAECKRRRVKVCSQCRSRTAETIANQQSVMNRDPCVSTAPNDTLNVTTRERAPFDGQTRSHPGHHRPADMTLQNLKGLTLPLRPLIHLVSWANSAVPVEARRPPPASISLIWSSWCSGATQPTRFWPATNGSTQCGGLLSPRKPTLIRFSCMASWPFLPCTWRGLKMITVDQPISTRPWPIKIKRWLTFGSR